MDSVRLAVISDLHIGDGARGSDLSPHSKPKIRYRDDNYKGGFLQFLKDEDVKADFLVVTGDISNTAHPDEFVLASDVIGDIANQLGVVREQILFVPGNHDVDWTVLKQADASGLRRKQRYDPLRNATLFSEVMSRASSDFLVTPHFCGWNVSNVLAIGYNSASHDGPTKTPHNGFVDPAHISELDTYLASVPIDQDQLRLFLVHHHPVQYSEVIKSDHDFSVMANAEELLKVLERHKFDLLIHGHKHSPRFRTTITDAGFPLSILGSGSFSAFLDIRWAGLVNNQFHIVQVDGRDNDEKCIFGYVYSWAYLCGHGWKKSVENYGIPHVTPFGSYLMPERLKAVVEQDIRLNFKSVGHLLWSEIVGRHDSLRYVSAERILETVDSLKVDLGFDRYGDPPDDFVLVK